MGKPDFLSDPRRESKVKYVTHLAREGLDYFLLTPVAEGRQNIGRASHVPGVPERRRGEPQDMPVLLSLVKSGESHFKFLGLTT